MTRDQPVSCVLTLIRDQTAAGDLYDKDEMVSTVDPYRAAGVSAVGLEDVMATPLGNGQTFDVATSARVTMGQLKWINREIGQLVGIDNRATLHQAVADYRQPMRKLRMIVGCTERGTPGAGNLLN